MVERSGRGRRVSDRKMEVQMELLKVIAEQNHEKLLSIMLIPIRHRSI